MLCRRLRDREPCLSPSPLLSAVTRSLPVDALSLVPRRLLLLRLSRRGLGDGFSLSLAGLVLRFLLDERWR